MINIQTQAEPKRKSERLSKDEMVTLKRYVKSFHTVVEAARAIDIHRNVLDLVLIRESGSPETVAAIRKKITERKAA